MMIELYWGYVGVGGYVLCWTFNDPMDRKPADYWWLARHSDGLWLGSFHLMWETPALVDALRRGLSL